MYINYIKIYGTYMYINYIKIYGTYMYINYIKIYGTYMYINYINLNSWSSSTMNNHVHRALPQDRNRKKRDRMLLITYPAIYISYQLSISATSYLYQLPAIYISYQLSISATSYLYISYQLSISGVSYLGSATSYLYES